MKKLYLVSISFWAISQPLKLYTHEIFSLRADLARQNGVNIDTMLKYVKAGRQYEAVYMNRVMYGLSQFLTLELRLPIFLEKKLSELNPMTNTLAISKASGLGKVELLTKFRVFYDYAPQKRNQIALIVGPLLPTCGQKRTEIEKKPIIGNRSIDFLVGVAGAFETTEFYHFASLSYRINTRARHIKEGNKLSYSYAFGLRLEKPDVHKVDWVFLTDIDGYWREKDSIHGTKLSNTGGHIIFVGPSVFRSEGNFMLKGGIQIPIAQHLNGSQEKTDFRAMVAAFLQF